MQEVADVHETELRASELLHGSVVVPLMLHVDPFHVSASV
jgi:hypothetical protein